MRTAIPRGASSVLLASRQPRKQRRSLVAQDRQGPNPARLRGGKPRRDRDDHQWIDPALFAAMLALPFGTSDLATQPAVTVAS